MFKKLSFVLLIVLALSALSGVAFAQDEKVIAEGLNNPRKINYGSDGTLYIAESGAPGDETGEGPFGPTKYSLTSQITAVSPEGEQSVVVGDLVSIDGGFGQIGATAVTPTEDGLWVALGVGLNDVPEGKLVDALVQYTGDPLAVAEAVDLAGFEVDNNPDQNPDDTVSNPNDIAVGADGTVYIADASANSVLSWTKEDGLKLFAAWPSSEDEAAAVPTTVEIGPEGDIYVAFLTGYPFVMDTARIEVYGTDGSLKKTYDNLSFITDLLVTADGTIYAVQFASGFGDVGWEGNSGSVITVADDGVTTVAEGLNFPYGIAQSPDGELVVSVDTFGAAPDSGRVISIGSI